MKGPRLNLLGFPVNTSFRSPIASQLVFCIVGLQHWPFRRDTMVVVDLLITLLHDLLEMRGEVDRV